MDELLNRRWNAKSPVETFVPGAGTLATSTACSCAAADAAPSFTAIQAPRIQRMQDLSLEVVCIGDLSDHRLPHSKCSDTQRSPVGSAISIGTIRMHLLAFAVYCFHEIIGRSNRRVAHLHDDGSRIDLGICGRAANRNTGYRYTLLLSLEMILARSSGVIAAICRLKLVVASGGSLGLGAPGSPRKVPSNL